MRERRATIRVPFGAEGTYEPGKGLSAPRLGFSQDLSLGGMRLGTAERLDPGERVHISIPLPAEGPVSMRGVVVWSREAYRAGQAGYECGLRWTEVDPASQARLNAFLTSATRDASITLSSGGAILPTTDWPRAVLFSAAAAALLLIAGMAWLNWFRISLQAQSYRYSSDAYERMIEHHWRRHL